ncbi:shikimate kinase [Terrarubrum flagellatum]|uniref:shikimate kinase n=1 Tax=Terrirubrum flagellatum TaxID=2895980 RepID=UPI003144DC76
MRAAIVLNGPINAGKSTVGARLAALLRSAVFIDGDDHDAPDDAPLAERIVAAWERIERLLATSEADHLVIAYPVEQESYARLRRSCELRGAELVVVTLAPPLEIALADRGGRILSAGERQRIVEMYEEGYTRREFSDFILDNGGMSVEEAAAAISDFIETRL